jgi:solute:Na+ symporter, SSS family
MPSLTNHQIESTVFLGLLGIMILIGFLAARWRRPRSMHSLEEWGVGGRAFGNWVTWFLIGGASYTGYTFIAVPSLTFGVGAFGMFAMPFALCTIPLVYLMSPRIWSVLHAHGFVSAAEFARARFGSRTVGTLVAIVGIAATMPYIAVQLIALQAVFKVIGLTGEWPLFIALGLISITTFRSGLRAPALLSIAKDVLLVWLLLSAVLVVAMSGGWSSTFQAANLRWTHDTSPLSSVLLPHYTTLTFLTLAVGSALSIFAYPHALLAIIAAKDKSTVRRNAAGLPVYTLALGMMALLGIFAVARQVFPVDADLAHGKIGDLNTITPMIFHNLFPAWCAGIAYATLAIASLIPASIMSIAAASLFTRSIYCEFFRPRASGKEEARVGQWASLFVKIGAVVVVLLLRADFATEIQGIGGVIILQTLPAVFFGLLTGWFHRWALVAGMIGGLAMSFYMLYQIPAVDATTGKITQAHFGGANYPLILAGIHSPSAVYVGIVTLVGNMVVVVVATALFRLVRIPAGVDLTRPADYETDADDEALDRLDHLLDGGVAVTGAHALR